MTVVVAIDEEDGSDRVFAEAQKLASRFDEPLHAVFVYEGSEHTALLNKSLNVDTSISDEQVGELAETVVTSAAEGITGEYETIGRIGNPAEQVVDYANKIDASYVVVGGRSRSPVGKALFGSVTQSVLLDADCPVLAVMNEA
jgi:nucleotide-binding universal stress UspA family protein